MADLSFLAAHLLGLVAFFLRRKGLEPSELAIGLGVIGPAAVAQLAVLLPRFAGTASFRRVSRAQTVVAWTAGAVFVAGAAWAADRAAAGTGPFQLVDWSLALVLGLAEAAYGLFAAWFVQSRAVFNERQVSALRERLAGQEFDVFLCHNSRDKPEVKAVALQLMARGIKPWLDEWELRPGFRWQPLLEAQIQQVKAAAVFVGPDGLGPWQSEELSAFLSECVNRNIPVIPVLLPNAPEGVRLPPFLGQRTWVDFRGSEQEALEKLEYGITGQRNQSHQPSSHHSPAA
jgi:TIR domain